MHTLRIRLASLGPGLLLAGAAIGVSHLVQATRAGADYGFSLWWILLFACLTKYPFLEFGPRYTAATGKTLLEGYRELGPWPFRIFLFITVGTMFIIQAALTIVTAGLAEQLFQFGLSHFTWSLIILTACATLLVVGRYRALDLVMKVIVSVLSIGTLLAVILALKAGTAAEVAATPAPSYWTPAGLAFVIALIGWMPIPLDSAVWHSIWLKEKEKLTGIKTSLSGALFDFNAGYLVAAGLGFLFLLLGALVMFGSGQSFAANSVDFSSQLAELYAATLGDWSRPLVMVAALMAMVSTTLTVTDAFPRVMSHIWATSHATGAEVPSERAYHLALLAIPAVALFILHSLTGTFTTLVDFAAGLAFLSAPVLAYFNYRLITGDEIPEEARPSRTYQFFAHICFVLLTLFALSYLLWLLL